MKNNNDVTIIWRIKWFNRSVATINVKHFHEKILRITHKGEPLLIF